MKARSLAVLGVRSIGLHTRKSLKSITSRLSDSLPSTICQRNQAFPYNAIKWLNLE